MNNSEKFMSRCLFLAQNGAYYVAPNPMVGAVLVGPDGDVLAEGWHQVYGGPHAEVNCFKDAEERGIPDELMKQSTLYVSLEPCSHYGKTPPCSELIIHKGVRKVVVGILDPNPLVGGRGIALLRQAGIEVEVGVLEAECREVNKRFLCLQEKKRPYVTLKWAETADGYLDVYRTEKGGGPLRISTDYTKQLVHKLRAMNMAIMVGSTTALLDDPRLTTTKWAGRNPIRVLVDRRNRVPKTARILNTEAETIVYSDNTEWNFILKDLAARNIHSIMVEGGAALLSNILSTGIYDEVHVEVSDRVLGGDGVKAPFVDLSDAKKTVLDGHILYEKEYR